MVHSPDAGAGRVAVGPVDGRDGVPAGLSGHLQPRRVGREGTAHPHRRLPPAGGDGRLHLQQGAPLRGPRLRRRPAPAPGAAPRGPGRGALPGRELGRGPRRRGDPDTGGPGARRRRGDPPGLVRRVERPRHTGHGRRRALPPARRRAARAHGLRRPDHDRRRRPLRPDARRHLRRLRAREAHHRLGRQPVDHRHPPRAARAGGGEGRRGAGGRRPPPHAAGRAGRHPPRRPPRLRRRGPRSRCTASSSRRDSPTTRS